MILWLIGLGSCLVLVGAIALDMSAYSRSTEDMVMGVVMLIVGLVCCGIGVLA